MKPKVSTGYLTPQGKKPKLASKRHNMSVREEENETPEINSQLVQALLQNPEKKKMILQLLALNKDVIEKHSSGSSLPSSVDKLKSRKVCESPTALMRRRALEKMNSPNASNNNLLSRPHSSSSSSTSSATTLDKVLEGVKAYVEIKDRHNQDKSQGAKEILKSMGATVVDKLSSEVTHVVFKDGSYKTFQMAKLLKVHIVSILWVEFSRKTLQRAQEKRFPAIGNEFEDETIVCSVFTQIVKKLGRFVVEDEVSEKTTHLVAGEAKRTLNMLRAIARGCWVLKHEWVLRSLEAGKWLPEENFELDDFSPAVRHCRLERQAFGENYAMDVFESCPPIYVSLETTPRCSDLRELIRTCKGKVVTNPRMAMIIVGQYIDGEHVCVTEKWVLDCVNFYEKMDLDDYLIEADNRKRKSFAV
ncbi:unnamed protein product [Ceutorhynchus assimilis]|uniref:BRCT domain-containing protein n=1 Tax=Ceutorhynchus assimilis TaxID=467358 RepID=A0A9N9N1I6_9CUCU|nr:unnamed protein product [Ceutorhynchus assimilis]